MDPFYRSYRAFLKRKFGCQVRKIPVNGGFSCPNRDGTLSLRGCDFCDNQAFSPVSEMHGSPVEQLLRVMQRHAYEKAFLPYFQPFSNTYAPVEKLQEIYEPVLALDKVVGLCIGTRPDCLDSATCTYLGTLAAKTYLSVELGLQSSHSETLVKINRGHTVEAFSEAVHRLNSLGVEVVAHVMLGLPGETPEQMLKTAEFCSKLPIQGIKIHQLLVIKGTPFEKLFYEQRITVFDLQEYAQLLQQFLEHLRSDIIVHRIIADGSIDDGLIAPLWAADKDTARNKIHRYLQAHECRQGSRLLKNSSLSQSTQIKDQFLQ